MYQDVTDHTRSHDLKIGNPSTPDEIIKVTSTHHQMMMPDLHGKVLATGPLSTVQYWDDETEEWATTTVAHGVEVVLYPKALCFQPHPEMFMLRGEFHQMRVYFFKCIDRLMSV